MKEHWQSVYRTKPETGVSWYKPHLEPSLRMISALRLSPDDPIIDVGAGASTLADDLLDRGFEDLTVLDLSGEALAVSKKRLGPRAGRVKWIEADITGCPLPNAHYALWHDRAVFHFLTSAADRERYRTALETALRSGGHAVLATFAPGGPEKCSGLEVVRYSPESLARELGGGFRLTESFEEAHRTPFDTVQPFTYALFEKKR